MNNLIGIIPLLITQTLIANPISNRRYFLLGKRGCKRSRKQNLEMGIQTTILRAFYAIDMLLFVYVKTIQERIGIVVVLGFASGMITFVEAEKLRTK